MGKKKVLFIGIGFYDYEESIIQEFEKLDYLVDYYSEVPPNSLAYRFYSRIKREEQLQLIRNRYSAKIAEDCGSDYDVVFVIKCEYLSAEAITIIKQKNAKARYILYLWDSLDRIPQVEGKLHFFDNIYSFDRLDCLANHKLVFNPLFYRNEYLNDDDREDESIYDIYHLGWYHSDRLKLIKKITRYCNENHLKYKMILFAGYFSYLVQNIFGGELKGNKRHLTFKTFSAKMNVDYILKSKSTLDIAHPQQSGLTMRTIELLGAQKKIITTNEDIINYDFYNPANIMVIDREDPILNKDFFESDYIPIPHSILKQYSITNWLKKMLK